MFITLEGIEGVGKSTHLAFIKRHLKEAGQTVVVTREPGGTPVAEAIRKVVLVPQEEPITPETELLLLFASRAQHIAQVIRPALAAGKSVICDRFTDATYAYQGAGRGMAIKRIAVLEKWVQAGLHPHCVLLLDAPVKVALKRIMRRKRLDRIEAEQEEFFQRVREGYLARAKELPNRYHVINAAAPITKVRKQIKDVLNGLLKKGKNPL